MDFGPSGILQSYTLYNRCQLVCMRQINIARASTIEEMRERIKQVFMFSDYHTPTFEFKHEKKRQTQKIEQFLFKLFVPIVIDNSNSS